MKVIFLQDVPRVARAGEVKEVADGYGRNFLIPQKLAVIADPSTLNTLEAQIKKEASSQAQTEEEMTDLAHQLDGKEITLKAKVGTKEQLYGSITSADIADELQNNGLVVDKKRIEIAEPIRKLGSHEVAIRLAKDAIPKIKVIVIEEETSQSDQ